MSTYDDDNFGHYDIEDEDDLRFYRQNRRDSVKKECVICKQEVFLLPHYDKCSPCVDKLERGWDPEY